MAVAEPSVHETAGTRAESPEVAGASVAAADDPAPGPAPEWSDDDGFVVHEWGTFTAVANEGGHLTQWRPLLGASDLPSFVYTQAEDTEGLRKAHKGWLAAAIRMETPVVYFYSREAMSARARVAFRQGTVTEWFPNADKSEGRRSKDIADWGRFDIIPDGDASTLPRESAPSHYYPARQTDAALVRRGDEREKFLFYRGVGRFGLKLRVQYIQDTIVINNDGEAGSHSMFVVHSVGDRVGFLAVSPEGEVSVPLPPADGSQRALEKAMRRELVATGLYGREADAMIATWRDYWFEDDGVRVFYLMDAEQLEARLPLSLEPKPDELVRTIVGRIELMTPPLRAEAQRIVDGATTVEAACDELREKHGRFADPLARGLSGDRLADVSRCLSRGE